MMSSMHSLIIDGSNQTNFFVFCDWTLIFSLLLFFFIIFFSYYLIQEILICIHFWHTETLSFVQRNSQLSLPICLYGKTIILNDWPGLFVMKLQSCLLLNLMFIKISVHKADMLWLALIIKDIWAN